MGYFVLNNFQHFQGTKEKQSTAQHELRYEIESLLMYGEMEKQTAFRLHLADLNV